MKKLACLLFVFACNVAVAQDNGKGTCPTIHSCPPAGMTQEQWSKDHTVGLTIPTKSAQEKDAEDYNQKHTVIPTIGMKISADDFLEHNAWLCEKINRTIVESGERDQVVCGSRYVYIDNGVIVSIQK